MGKPEVTQLPVVTQRRASRPLPQIPQARHASIAVPSDDFAKLDLEGTGHGDEGSHVVLGEGLPSYGDSLDHGPHSPPTRQSDHGDIVQDDGEPRRVSAILEKRALEAYGEQQQQQQKQAPVPAQATIPSHGRVGSDDRASRSSGDMASTLLRTPSTTESAFSEPERRPVTPVSFPVPQVHPGIAPPPFRPTPSDTRPRSTYPSAREEKLRLRQQSQIQNQVTVVPSPAELVNAPDVQLVRGAGPIPPSYGDSTTAGPSTSRTRSRPSHGIPLLPTDLYKIDYGSHFIPHSYATVTSSLPLVTGLTLVGTSQGLSVLVGSGPEGGCKPIWTGYPVWSLTLLRHDTTVRDHPRGSVLIHCGGVEDGSSGRPRRDAEARIWKAETLTSLARWASQQTDYDGLDLAPLQSSTSRKGKGTSFSFRGGFMNRSNSTATVTRTQPYLPRQGEDLAMAWTKESNLLPGNTTNIMSISVLTRPEEINIALTTPNSIIVYSATLNSTGSYTFAPLRPFYIPFTPLTCSFVELEIQGTLPNQIQMQDNRSSLFEWDDAESIMDLGEAVSGRTLGLFVTFSGARGSVIRTSDSGVVELKKGGRGEWLPLLRVREGGGDSEVYVFTRGSESFVFPAPIPAPLATQPPIADLTWPELPIAVHAMPGHRSDIQLLGITPTGTIHVIDLTFGTNGIQKDWSSVQGACGGNSRFLSRRGKDSVDVASRSGERDWRVAQIHA